MDDQVFSNEQVLDTPGEGVTSGALTVVDLSTGIVEAISGKLVLVGSDAWNETGIFQTTGVSRELGKALFFTASVSNINGAPRIGWNTSAALATAFPHGLSFDNAGIRFNTSSGLVIIGTTVASTDYETLIVLGGYDSNGIPFKLGDTIGDFLYGSHAFIRGGVFAAWTLVWTEPSVNTATMYAIANHNPAGFSTTLHNIIIPVPVLDPSIMFHPQFLATFTGDNDDSLFLDYIPEVGSKFQTGAFDLMASFNDADDQPFVNEQVINTIEEGAEAGSLTVVNTGGGSVEVVNGKLELVGDGEWDRTGFFDPTGISRVLGKVVFSIFNSSTVTNRYMLGFESTAALSTAFDGGAYQIGSDGTIRALRAVPVIVGDYSASTDYKFAILLGGHDSNEIPWISGDVAADNLYGYRLLVKGGAFTNWTLLWIDVASNTSPEYLVSNQRDTDTTLLDNLYIPTNPLSPSIMFQPKYLSTFTGANGTQIVAYDPEVGGRLESGGITWTIQDNEATNNPGLGSELIAAVADREFTGGDNWVDVGLTSFDTTGDLSISGNVPDLAELPVINAPTTASSLYVLEFDIANIVSLWRIRTKDTGLLIGDVAFNGSKKLYFISDDGGFKVITLGVPSTGDFNNFSLKEITLNEIFATDDLGITQGIFDVDVTIPTTNDGFAGLVLALNSVNSPTDYIEVFYNRATGKVEVTKFVAGSPTSLMNETTAYGGAGTQLRAILTYISATDDLKLRVYYNGALVGTEQTIEDNGIAGNTRHGIMSVSPNNSLDNFTVHSLTDSDWDAEILRAKSTWRIQDNKAVNNPGVGSELITVSDNKDFTVWGNVTWIAHLGSIADGTGKMEVTLPGAGRGGAGLPTAPEAVVGKTYKVAADVWQDTTTTTDFFIQFGGGVSEIPITIGAGQATITGYITSDSASTLYIITDDSDGGKFFVDNVSVEQVTLNEIFATDDLGITQGIFDADVTIPTASDSIAGLVLALDSVNSPANYIEVFYNRGTGKVEVAKYVAGSRTSLINETTGYSAGAQLRVILTYISATDDLKLRVYYDGALVGTEQTIEDNDIAGNTRHGMMSVSPNSSLENFTVHSLTDGDWDAEITLKTEETY